MGALSYRSCCIVCLLTWDPERRQSVWKEDLSAWFFYCTVLKVDNNSRCLYRIRDTGLDFTPRETCLPVNVRWSNVNYFMPHDFPSFSQEKTETRSIPIMHCTKDFCWWFGSLFVTSFTSSQPWSDLCHV